MEKRHIVLLKLDERMLNILFREEAMIRCMAGVPADAVFQGANFDYPSRSIIVAFEHPSFPATQIGMEYPRRPVVFEIVNHPSEQLGLTVPKEIGNGPSYEYGVRARS